VYQLLEVFPIRPAVLPSCLPAGRFKGLVLNESKTLDEASKITFMILRTNGRTVRWEKYRDYRFIDCTGIRRKDGRNYIRAYLKEQENLSAGVKRG